MLKHAKIHLLVTGGTLDKDYDPLSGELIFPPTHVPKILQQARVSLELEITPLMALDSLQMTDADRLQIAQACLQTAASAIVITHGTDTMVKTGEKLQQLMQQAPWLGLSDKTIVLTGAMRPFALSDSDASFNLGASLLAAQMAPPGVYVCMNGQLHSVEAVQKNRRLGRFEARTP
ncbi:MAG: asparaginase [Thiotrichales bacterium]|nr:asparaginase [Thiotrichales bacterium]